MYKYTHARETTLDRVGMEVNQCHAYRISILEHEVLIKVLSQIL